MPNKERNARVQRALRKLANSREATQKSLNFRGETRSLREFILLDLEAKGVFSTTELREIVGRWGIPAQKDDLGSLPLEAVRFLGYTGLIAAIGKGPDEEAGVLHYIAGWRSFKSDDPACPEMVRIESASQEWECKRYSFLLKPL